MKRGIIYLTCMLTVLFFLGCRHSSSDSGSQEATSLSGTVACPEVSAVVELSFDPGSDSTVTGSLTSEGSIPLTGTYDADTGTLIASYEDENTMLTLTGTYSSDLGFSGTITWYIVADETETICTVSAQVDEEDDSVQNYLGTYGYDLPATGNGTWNMSIKGGVATGTYASSTNSTVIGRFSGTATDTGITVDDFYAYDSTSDAYYHLTDYGWATHAEGTFAGDTLSGTWYWNEEAADDDDVSGTFTGTLQ